MKYFFLFFSFFTIAISETILSGGEIIRETATLQWSGPLEKSGHVNAILAPMGGVFFFTNQHQAKK